MRTPGDTTLPTLTPLARPLNDEELAERQRLHVRRSYHRKQNMLQALRDDVKQLEGEYKELVEQKRHDEALDALAGLIDLVGKEDTGVVGLYAELTELKEQLLQENDAMQLSLRDCELFVQKVRTWIDTNQSVEISDRISNIGEATTCTLSVNQPERGSWVALPSLRKPLNADLCHTIVERMYSDMTSFQGSPHFITTGLSVFGWSDKRVYEDNVVKFALEKTFLGHSAPELAVKSFNILASVKNMPMLFNPVFSPRVIDIQTVSEGNSVMLCAFSTPDGSAMVQSVFLVSQFEIPTGYCIIVRSLDQDVLAPYDPPIDPILQQWEIFSTWILFEHAGNQDHDCKVRFGADISVSQASDSAAWMLEVLYFIMRWESRVIGPIYSLEYAP